MTARWAFDPCGPTADLQGAVPLAIKGMAVPATPGLYVITCGGCMPHVGTSGSLRNRLRTLATLGSHRGSAEVLCAAFCTREPPLVWWERHETAVSARERERAFKAHYGEPPQPRPAHAKCVHGSTLLSAIIAVAGPDSWEAGFATAVFRIGQNLRLLFQPRFASIWTSIGVPPGPWDGFVGSTALPLR